MVTLVYPTQVASYNVNEVAMYNVCGKRKSDN